MMGDKNSDLIQKAKEFEDLIEKLGSKKAMFSKAELEVYHAEMESRMDDNMTKFEDSITVEYNQKEKRSKYENLSLFLMNGFTI